MNFGKVFAKRCLICYFLLCLLFLFGCLRLSSVALGNYGTVQQTQNERTIFISALRGTVYDRNGQPLTNRKTTVFAAVAPNDENQPILQSLLSDDNYQKIASSLQAGKPTVCRLKSEVRAAGIVCANIPLTKDNVQPARHLIGYTDAEGHGVSGLEAAYDALLCGGSVNAVFNVDATGRALGEGIRINQTSPQNALYTTLDLQIQSAVEAATAEMDRGAAILCNPAGEILAAVSRPDFDTTDPAATLNDPDSPQLNRVLTAYSVGSVFKPCVAAAGLESGIGDLRFDCPGRIQLGNRGFHCHRISGHGTLSLSGALENSCNIYFYKYAKTVGIPAIRHIAQALNFGSAIRLCDGIYSARGNLPAIKEFVGDAAIFNFAIGQGALTLSPVALCTLYSAIARDGTYILPHLESGILESGIYHNTLPPAPTRAMSESTAKALRKSLERVVTTGTGTAAQSKYCTVAGKTATAQTGRYQNGKESTVGWFCGYFPAENPKYIGVVCMEDANGKSAAAVFAQIVDAIQEIS